MKAVGKVAPPDPGTKPTLRDIHWKAVGRGYAFSLAGTLVLGVPALWLSSNVWWVAASGTLALFWGGWVAAQKAQTSEPLNGAFLGLLYFATVALVIFVGAIGDWLPEPLPGLPRGDSTFFFVFPLAQILASTLGAIIGGRRSREQL